MGNRHRGLTLALVSALGACTSTPSDTGTPVSVEPSTAPEASASASEAAEHFPIEAFANISENPVSKDEAAELQALLDDMAGRAGIAATVMSPDGTWSGATGKADGVRDVRVDDQFFIASITKSIIAAQVMEMVEAGELQLDDPATDHLAPDLDFDTNGATIRQLLGQRSGIPQNDFVAEDKRLLAHPRRLWTPAEVLEFVPPDRSPTGEAFEYANANYVLLGLVIEQVRGRPVADVLRDGVLNVGGTERLIYQPDEKPTAPMAMPGGHSTAALREGGGYLPSLAAASADGAAAAMASDAPSLARWWQALCAGAIVSKASLTEMTTLSIDEYGLGVYDVAEPYANAVGHTGEGISGTYVSWAGCLPEEQAVIVVLANHPVDDIGAIAEPLVDAVSD